MSEFFRKINKIGKPSFGVRKIRNESGDFTTNFVEMNYKSTMNNCIATN